MNPLRLITLGTGHGNPNAHRKPSALLVETGPFRYLFDCGDGATTSLIRYGCPPVRLNAVFISHMHLDHVSSLPLLLSQIQKHWAAGTEKTVRVHLPDQEADPGLNGWLDATELPRQPEKSVFFRYIPALFLTMAKYGSRRLPHVIFQNGTYFRAATPFSCTVTGNGFF